VGIELFHGTLPAQIFSPNAFSARSPLKKDPLSPTSLSSSTATTMGIKDILPHLPGGDKFYHSFYSCALVRDQAEVPIDAAGLLWQCANNHADDYLKGNYHPALTDFAKKLNDISCNCKWKLILIMDGRSNPDEQFEDARRQKKASAAQDDIASPPSGLIRNTPEYIARAVHICKHMAIRVIVAAYEADGQVVKQACASEVMPITGDSDLLAIGCGECKLERLMVVKTWFGESFRIIDLTEPSTNRKFVRSHR
jgi:hypothetical protein